MKFVCTNCRGVIEAEDVDRGNPVACGHCEKFVVVPNEDLEANVVINNDFVLEERLGQGGVGVVWKAHQISLDRPVALKILMEQFTTDKGFIEDFIREARSAARLNHPNIVQSFAVGQDEGIFFCAMELVEGETLKDVMVREGKVSLEYSVKIMRQMGEALDFAWKNQKLVHRDIKPDNVMLTTGGVAKLADLGLARVANETSSDDEEIMGTPQYICPEQLIGGHMDVRSDIYSLGATWYHIITGKFPFDGETAIDIAHKHLEEPLVPPMEVASHVPRNISQMIEKMMAKHPDDRYDDAESLIKDLKLLVDENGVLRRGKPMSSYSNKVKRKFHTGTNTAAIRRTGTQKFNVRQTTNMSSNAAAASHKTQAHVVAEPQKSGKSSLGIIMALVSTVVIIALGAVLLTSEPQPVDLLREKWEQKGFSAEQAGSLAKVQLMAESTDPANYEEVLNACQAVVRSYGLKGRRSDKMYKALDDIADPFIEQKMREIRNKL